MLFYRIFLAVLLLHQLNCQQQCLRHTVSFIQSVLRDCVSDAWIIHEISLDAMQCAMKCARLSKCRAFATIGGCRLFVFDECSRGLVLVGTSCNRSSVINVKRISGVSAGRVCPSSFVFNGNVSSFSGSLYRLTGQSVNWKDGTIQCKGADGIPSKLVELDDGAIELANIRRSAGPPPEFWVAAVKASSGIWQWASCHAQISSDMWDSGEPNDFSVNAARIRNLGLADISSSTKYPAVCECVDPFYQP